MKISQTVFKYYVQKLDVTDSTNNWLRNTPMMLMDALDSYIFTPSFSSPVDVARGELKVTMAESDAEKE